MSVRQNSWSIMAAIIKAGFQGYVYLFHDLIDRRSEHMFLMYSVWQPVSILAAYLYFVLCLGPKLMKDRPPMKTEFIMKLYNLLQIFFCIYVMEISLTLTWPSKYRLFCEPVDFTDSPEALEVMRGVWTYMMLKLFDLTDTIFLVLRKKWTHLTFLHLYHHPGIFLGSWLATKFLPGGHGIFLGGINCFVHIIMYSYYFVALQWPDHKNRRWWKKYITQLQMIQFLLLILHSLPVLFMKECNYPKITCGIMVVQYSWMFFLFLDFYIKEYVKKTTKL